MSAGIAAAVASIAGPILGGVIGSSSASDAANAQVQAAQQASQVQQNEFNQIQANLQPWMRSGQNANYLLSAFMGMTPAQEGESQIYNQLLPQFTTTTNQPGVVDQSSLPGKIQNAIGTGAATYQFDPSTGKWGYRYSTGVDDYGVPDNWEWYYPQNQSSTTVNQAGLNAAVQNAMAQQNQLAGAASSIAGLGIKPFTYDESQDPMAQTMLQMGSQAIANQRSALGGVNSGATLQALSDYGQKTAASSYQQEYNNYYNRLNQIYNMLAGVSQSGQNAAAGVGNAGMSTANALASNALGAGNAQAAGSIGNANALSGALSGVSNGLLNNAFLGSFGNSGVPGSTLAAANLTSDPIGSLISSMGW